jgi:dihydroxyacetone kinase-like protein
VLTVDNTKVWLRAFASKIQENKAYLSELDRVIGDGDHGSNMARGVEAMVAKFDESDFSSPEDVLKTAAMALLGKIGGASGPLYGSALLEMSKQTKVDRSDIQAIIQAGLVGIKNRGKAEKGEKTMVDLWTVVVDQLALGELTNEVINEAVEATKELKATKGRASYLGDRSIGEVDPGAKSSSYLFKAMLEGDIING